MLLQYAYGAAENDLQGDFIVNYYINKERLFTENYISCQYIDPHFFSFKCKREHIFNVSLPNLAYPNQHLDIEAHMVQEIIQLY